MTWITGNPSPIKTEVREKKILYINSSEANEVSLNLAL